MNGKKYIEGSVFQGLIFALTLLIGVLCETSRGPARGRLPQCPRTASASGVRLIYEHPFHCTKFIECWGAQRTVKDCPPGTAFSKRLRACDHFHNVDECGVSGYSICQGVKDYECGKAPASFHHVPNSNRLDNEAAKNFPWHAAIYRKERGKFQHVCGGALILPNLVLTAAHCFYDSKPVPELEGRMRDYRVAVGKVYKDWNYAERTVHRRNVSQVWKGKKYMGSEAGWQSDFALVKLDSPVECVTPVCVDWDNRYHSFDTPEGTLVAWGGKDRPRFGRTLHQTSINPLTHNASLKICGALAPKVGEKNFCAKGTDKGEPLRQGDSGEVLMFMINGRRFARGIVSSAFNEDNLCTVFTGVKSYIEELKDMVSDVENQ